MLHKEWCVWEQMRVATVRYLNLANILRIVQVATDDMLRTPGDSSFWSETLCFILNIWMSTFSAWGPMGLGEGCVCAIVRNNNFKCCVPMKTEDSTILTFIPFTYLCYRQDPIMVWGGPRSCANHTSSSGLLLTMTLVFILPDHVSWHTDRLVSGGSATQTPCQCWSVSRLG